MQGAIDLGGDGLVALTLGRGGHELLVPGVHLAQVSKPPLRERAQEVQRCHGLVVGLEQTVRVWGPVDDRERLGVHDMATERVQDDAVSFFGGAGPRLGELSGDSTDLDDA